jgi:hypothetical protein
VCFRHGGSGTVVSPRNAGAYHSCVWQFELKEWTLAPIPWLGGTIDDTFSIMMWPALVARCEVDKKCPPDPDGFGSTLNSYGFQTNLSTNPMDLAFGMGAGIIARVWNVGISRSKL